MKFSSNRNLRNVIELTFPGENGAGNHKQVYTAGKRDGNPSIEDLIAEALNISGSLAREYTSRKPGIDDKHSDGDKIYATGKVIDAITFYTAGRIQLMSPQTCWQPLMHSELELYLHSKAVLVTLNRNVIVSQILKIHLRHLMH